MSDLDSKLTEVFRADAPPARDARFRLEVLLRIERARFQRRVIRTLAVAVVAAALVALNIHAIEAWISTDLWRLSVLAIAAAVAIFSLSGVPVAAIPGLRGFARTLGRWLYP
jgi:hypothetical protein